MRALGTRGYRNKRTGLPVLVLVLALSLFLSLCVLPTPASDTNPTSDWQKTEYSPVSGTGQNGRGLAFGDVNGDGYDDLIVGSPDYRNTNQQNLDSEVGIVRIYLSSTSGLVSTAFWESPVTPPPNAPSDRLGNSIAAGDIDGDEVDEFLVAERPMFSPQVHLYDGFEGTPTPTDPAWSCGGFFGPYLKTPLVHMADLNGDDKDDAIITSGGSTTYAPAVHVFYGSSGGLAASADWSDDFGGVAVSVFSIPAGAADVNGDGKDDLLFSSENDSVFYVYHGAVAGLGADPTYTITQGDGYYGRAVAGAGDVNNDGYEDVVINWKSTESFGPTEVYVYFGSAQGLQNFDRKQLSGGAETTYWGSTVGSAGHFNDDAFADVIVGGSFGELVIMYFGAENAATVGFLNTQNYTCSPSDGVADFGYSMAFGNTFGHHRGGNDIAIGAPDDGSRDEGTAYAYYGHHPPPPPRPEGIWLIVR